MINCNADNQEHMYLFYWCVSYVFWDMPKYDEELRHAVMLEF
jgi:hypothetical protein